MLREVHAPGCAFKEFEASQRHPLLQSFLVGASRGLPQLASNVDGLYPGIGPDIVPSATPPTPAKMEVAMNDALTGIRQLEREIGAIPYINQRWVQERVLRDRTLAVRGLL